MRLILAVFALPVAFLIFLTASAHAAGMLSGAEYLATARSLQATSSIPSNSLSAAPAQGGSGVSDIAGSLTGTIGSGAELGAVIIGDGQSHIVNFGTTSMPPLGANIRVLARLGETPSGKSQLTLIAWAFGSDVARAATKAQTAPPSATRQSSSAGRSRLASRGGTPVSRAIAFKYFDDFARYIKGINPRLSESDVRDITTVLLNTSAECDVDPRLAMAVVLAESGFNPNATSRKGAMGLGQLMPGTARGMGVTDPYDPGQNLDASIRLIRSGLNKYSGNKEWKDLNWGHLRLALAAYNAGSGAVKKYGGIPPFRETQNYIAKVSSYYKQLCGQR